MKFQDQLIKLRDHGAVCARLGYNPYQHEGTAERYEEWESGWLHENKAVTQ